LTVPRLLGSYRLLSTHVAIHVDDPEVRAGLALLLEQFSVEEPGGRVVVVVAEEEGFRGTIDDGRPFMRAKDAQACVTHLVFRLNELVAETPTDRLVVHASVAGFDAGAILFPGNSGAGKSTLVAGLVRSGCSYVTDELAVLPLGTSTVEPYPRSITLEQGAWSGFPELEGRAFRGVDQWFVPPDRLRAGCVAPQPLPVVGVVFPQATPGADTSLRPLGRAAALMRLSRQAVNLAAQGGEGFHTLAGIVREAQICAELTAGTVSAAVEAVRRAASQETHRGR
jgi:hypothetical protein